MGTNFKYFMSWDSGPMQHINNEDTHNNINIIRQKQTTIQNKQI